MINFITNNKKFRKVIKMKLIAAKFLIAIGAVHPVKHEPHIHMDRYRKIKFNTEHSLIK